MGTETRPRGRRTKREPDPGLLRYLEAARLAGCPRDQAENFLRAGVVLQPKQLRASAAARLCDAEGGPTRIGYGGSRGGGKSFWGIAQVVCDDCQRFPGLKFLYLRKVGKAGKEAVQDLRREVLHSTPHEYKAQDGLIQLPNGSRVVLGHFLHEKDIDSYLGLQYDGALIEEATQLTARKVRDIRTCVRTSKAGWRPRTYYTTNPGNIGHAWFKSLFIEPLRRGPESATRFIQATVRDNRFVNSEYRRELEELTGWERRAWLDGDWEIAAGQFFTSWRAALNERPHHVVPAFPLPAGWRKGISLDYGFTHYTVCHLLAEDGDGTLYAVDEHAERRRLPAWHAPAIHAMLARHGLTAAELDWRVAGADLFAQRGMRDGHAQTIAETYKELGLEFSPANTDRIAGASEILSRLGELGDPEAVPPLPALPPRLFVFERCARLIECLPLLQHDPSYPEKVLKWDTDGDGLGGDDPYDSFRYGVMAAWQRSSWAHSAAYWSALLSTE